MKKVFLILLGLFWGLQAAAAPPAPDAVVKSATAELQGLIRVHHEAYKADLATFYQVVDKVVVPHFDVPFIARSVLARNWRTANDEQRARFSEAFKNMLIRSYANALLEYHDSVDAQWKPMRMAADSTDVVVHSTLVRDEGRPSVALNFAMHRVGDAWKIYDIVIENISLVQNFRGQFQSEIRRTGLDAVIVRMETGELGAASATAASGSM